MTNASTEIIKKLNELIRKRFQLGLERQDLNNKVRAEEALIKEKYSTEVEGIEKSINEVDNEIFSLINQHRKELIEEGKQSFATIEAIFQFRRLNSIKVTDESGLMKAARRLRVVKKIANPIRSYKLDRSKFYGWLKKNPSYQEKFSDYIKEEDGESLTIKPNKTFTVMHNSKRVSPPSIKIEQNIEKEQPY